MITSFLIRVLLILGLTLAPVFLVNQWYVFEVCGGSPETMPYSLTTRYALLIIVGSIALALMLAVCA